MIENFSHSVPLSDWTSFSYSPIYISLGGFGAAATATGATWATGASATNWDCNSTGCGADSNGSGSGAKVSGIYTFGGSTGVIKGYGAIFLSGTSACSKLKEKSLS
jgi:hypothetical protein